MAISGRDQGMLDWTSCKTDGGWSQSTENMAQACVTGKRAANGREAWRAAKEAEWAVREHREPGRGVSVQEALWGALPLCVCAHSSRVRLCNPRDCYLPGSLVHGDSPGRYTGVGCHALLQGIFPTQGSNPGLLHCR